LGHGTRFVIKILYVEDNDDNVYMLKMWLELDGRFEVLHAENGKAGVEMAIRERPDLILMDLELPVIDGWEASRQLKSNQLTRNIPIIALSAHALSGSREKALAAGCDEFDTKPVDFDRLFAKMRRFVEPTA
jgi:two-component system cell cycle response regulator DivK